MEAPISPSARPSVVHRGLAPALFGATLLALPQVALAAPDNAGPLQIEVAEGIDDGERFPEWINERNSTIEDALPTEYGAPGIRIEVEGRYLDFRFRVIPMRDGEPVGEPETQECKCSNEDLLMGIDLGIQDAILKLGEAPSEPGSEPEPQPSPEPEPEPAPEQSERSGLSPMTGAGIGAAAVGVAELIAGAILVTRDDERAFASSGALEIDRTSYRTPGIVSLGVGGVLVLAGVALVTVGLARPGKSSDAGSSRRSSRRWSWAPAVGPTAFGAQLKGKF